ncbi:hypothetical protein Pmani_016770 [Petrolisthes manimaculis]|uniref:Uncharacterized protein n=1 Tax=Petrolisthes manimaculis TaxID=1843537 RepID=A0AAE1PPP4_9EUCA|nr:hypothetical protein Pmani_016770 [Petrolisthes manimaculis]
MNSWYNFLQMEEGEVELEEDWRKEGWGGGSEIGGEEGEVELEEEDGEEERKLEERRGKWSWMREGGKEGERKQK